MRLLPNLFQVSKTADTYRKLIRKEAAIGGSIFGPVESGRHREFFCLDEHTWVWHEEYVDQYGKMHAKTTRYEVQPDRVLKVRDGQYFRINREEAKNLLKAAETYQAKVHESLYSR